MKVLSLRAHRCIFPFSLEASIADSNLLLPPPAITKRSRLPCVSSNASNLRVVRKTWRRQSILFAQYRRTSYFAESENEKYKGIGENECPWEGAIVYRRSASQTHLEFSTTLERLGLSKLSSELSESTASTMGIRLVVPPRHQKEKEDYHNCSGTPLQISIDVTRKGCDLQLDGLLRTFIGLPCYRCGEPAVKRVFSNFCLLLREKPIEELFDMDMTIDFEKDKAETGYLDIDDGDEEELDLDLDDQMYFPFEEKEIDISKYFRDIVQLEYSMDALCDLNCKGSCFNCGSNLNRSTCKCTNKNELVVDASIQKPNKQMQQH